EQGDGDIKDSWESVSSIGFRMHEWRDHAGPGRWNDPDMPVLGRVGWGAEHPPLPPHPRRHRRRRMPF
ncbi:MAG: hypothetical protein LBC18_04440, partial [Opitutaceae bacterium]|nr:hypothetical protein [Opitutaceae bacterium]